MTYKYESELRRLNESIGPLFKGWNSVERRKQLTQEEVSYLLDQVEQKPEIIIDGREGKNKGNTVMHEMLLSFKCQELLEELRLTTWDILQNIRGQSRTFELLTLNVELVIEKIKNGEKASINVEPEDMLHPGFLDLFQSIPEEYRSNLMIEFIESEHHQNTSENIDTLISHIKLIQDMGYLIAIDDWYNEDLNSDLINNRSYKNLSLLLDNSIAPDVIKVEGEIIENLYNGTLSNNTHEKEINSGEIEKIRNALANLKNTLEERFGKSIVIVGEWINSLDMGDFATKYIGVDYLQGRDLNQADFQK